MADKILGYKELLKTLLEYHIHFIKRLSREGYEQTFSVILIPLHLIAMLPGTDWNGAQNVHRTILEALGKPAVEDCVVEYPTDGEDAFKLISALYARLEEIKSES